MTALINLPRAAWKRQPSGLVSVDLANPANRDLALLVTPSMRINAVNQSLLTIAGTRLHISSLGRSYGFSSVLGIGSTDKLDTVVNKNLSQKSVFIIALRNGAGGNTLGRLIDGPGFRIYNNDSFSGYVIESNFSENAQGDYSARQNDGGFFRLTITHNGQAGVAHKFYNSGIAASSTVFSSGLGTVNSGLGTYVIGNRDGLDRVWDGAINLVAVWSRVLSDTEIISINQNPWQLFKPAPSRFYLIPSSGGATTYTTTLSIDALIQRAGLTQSTSIDALLQSAFSTSLSLDSLVAAVQSKTLSLDALLQIVGTRTVSVDALLQAAKSGTVSIDSLVQMTLAQSLSLDALIMAASTSSAAVSLDALIQAFQTAGISLDALLSTAGMQSVGLDALLQSGKTGSISLDGLIQAIQTKTLSLDALLSQSMNTAAVMDALIQSSKTGAVSLDALITWSSVTTIFTGLDALIQAIQSKTISLDALLQKTYTSPLALDAYVALTQVKTVSLDALLQSTKSGVISLDAILQMTKNAMVSFDALIQAAKTGVISLDAILVFATQASVLLDAYVQKTLARGVGLDAIIGSIADMILPTGRVITVPASDRFVFVTHSDRVIQIQ